MALLNLQAENTAFFLFIFGALALYTSGTSFSENAMWAGSAQLFTIPRALVDLAFSASPLLGALSVIAFLFYWTQLYEHVGESIALACIIGAIALYLGA